MSKTEQTETLQKDWYVYYSFRDFATGKLKRQQNIKAGANRHKDKHSRFSYLKTLETSLLHLLQLGFNPYEDNATLENEYFNDDVENNKNRFSYLTNCDFFLNKRLVIIMFFNSKDSSIFDTCVWL